MPVGASLNEKQEGVDPPDLTMCQEIMLGMVEGLHFPEEADKIRRNIMTASDRAFKMNRKKQFEMIFNYFVKGMEFDPTTKAMDKSEFEAKTRRTVADVREVYARGLAPNFIEAAVSYIGLEFDWIATMAMVDYDNSGEIYTDLQDTKLESALKEAHGRLYRPSSFEIIAQRKFIGLRAAHVYKIMVSGVNIVKDVKEFVEEYGKGKELCEAGDITGARSLWRNTGRILAQLSYLMERQITESVHSSDEEAEHVVIDA